MKSAFKEWAVVVDALGRGDQILILRKGGISEGRGGFQIDHEQFWLFPTLFHQQAESVILPAGVGHSLLETLRSDPSKLPVQYLARVHAWTRLSSLKSALSLTGQHIWKEEVISQRFDWGRDQSIAALLVRIYRVPEPILLPLMPSYGGCKSWIEFEVDLPTREAEPVLSDAVFQKRVDAANRALTPSGGDAFETVC